MINKILVIFVVILNLSFSIIAFEPITIGLGAAVLGAFGYNFQKPVLEQTYCKFRECCINDHIPADITALERELRNSLFGQHIVLNTLISSLRTHYEHINDSRKALAITFHGTTGTGKNFVSEMIVKNIFKYGSDSKYVKKYLGRLSFPRDSHVETYREFLRNDITYTVMKCPKSIFIFDEVDKMPVGILEAIAPMLDHHDNIDGVSFRQAVFIFLTNTAGYEISLTLAAFMRQGVSRDDVKLKNFEELCQKGAFNIVGGLQNSGVIEASLIDHYIPFLPLEQMHLEKCIKKEFERFPSTFWNPEDINTILEETTMEENTGLFVASGCKRISKKVEALNAKKKKN